MNTNNGADVIESVTD